MTNVGRTLIPVLIAHVAHESGAGGDEPVTATCEARFVSKQPIKPPSDGHPSRRIGKDRAVIARDGATQMLGLDGRTYKRRTDDPNAPARTVRFLDGLSTSLAIAGMTEGAIKCR